MFFLFMVNYKGLRFIIFSIYLFSGGVYLSLGMLLNVWF